MYSGRERSIELLRIVYMFGVCMIHVVGKGAYPCRWFGNLLKICVPGFVFISGYYGVRFSLKKFFALYAQGLIAAIIGGILYYVLYCDCEDFSVPIFVNRVVQDMRWFWFLHAYAILLMFSPILNAGIDNVKITGEVKQFYPFFILFFAWAFLNTLGHTKRFVFSDSVLEVESAMTLIGVYFCARLFNIAEIEHKIKTKWAILTLLLGLPFAAIGVACGNSIIAFAMVASLFLLFKRIVIIRNCYSIVRFIVPSLFSIYMLHSTEAGLRLICRLEDFLIDIKIPVYLMYFLAAIAVFLVSLVADLPRRCLLQLFIRRSKYVAE